MHRLALLALLLAATPALAEVTPEQKALAEKARLSLTAFACSVLAEKKGDPAEQSRLFMLGYDEGMTFLQALEAGELTDEAINEHVPVAFLWSLGGPTHDFSLGRVYEGAVEAVYDRVFTDTDETIRKLEAENEFRRRNCGLLK